MRKLLAGTAFCALLATASGADAAVNLLTNGSFETGNFSGWTVSGNTGFTGVSGTFFGVAPEDGAYQVYAGPIGSDVVISQGFADTAGDAYTATGWLYGFGGSPSNFTMSVTDSSSNLLGLVFFSPVPAMGWTQFSVSFIGTGSDILTIRTRNDPSYQLLDNFQVMGSAAVLVPELSTWAMMGVGFAALGFAGYRRARGERVAAI